MPQQPQPAHSDFEYGDNKKKMGLSAFGVSVLTQAPRSGSISDAAKKKKVFPEDSQTGESRRGGAHRQCRAEGH